MEKSIDVQRLIRNNTEDLHQYARDLKLWETEMKRKDRELSNQPKPKDIPPIRKKSKTEEITDDKKKEKSTSKISGFDYSSWDKYDANKACEEIDKDDSDEDEDTDVDEEDLDRIATAVYNKEQGNKLVKEGKWGEAIEKYNLAIQTYPHDAVFYANRALCFLKMKNFISAEADCTSSLRIDNTYVKAYQRRAIARRSINQFQESRNDILKILELEPNNKQAEIDLIDLNKKLNIPHTNSHQNKYASSASTNNKPSTPSSVDKKKIKDLSNSTIKQNSNQDSTNKVKIPTSGSTNTNILDLSWIPSYDETKYSVVQPISKPPHQRSKKPLQKINIISETEIIVEKTKNIEINYSNDGTKSMEIDTGTKLLEIDTGKTNNKVDDQEADKEINLVKDKKNEKKESENNNKKAQMEILENAWKELQNSNPYKKSSNNTSCNKKSNTLSERNISIPVSNNLNIPSVPNTCTQFELNWKTLKDNEEKLYLYLKQIDGVKLPNIFEDGLESNIFIDILTCLANQFIKNCQDVGKYLLGLSNVKRMNTLVMFMTESEKLLLINLLDYCVGRHEISENQVELLKEKFEL